MSWNPSGIDRMRDNFPGNTGKGQISWEIAAMAPEVMEQAEKKQKIPRNGESGQLSVFRGIFVDSSAVQKQRNRQ